MTVAQALFIFVSTTSLIFLWSLLFGKNKLVLTICVFWMSTILWASHQRCFEQIELALFFTNGTLILWLGMTVSFKSLRQTLFETDPTLLVGSHVFRAFFGLILIGAGVGETSVERFSIPWAWAEIAVGALALPVARSIRGRDPMARQLFWLWNAFGVLSGLNGLRRMLWASSLASTPLMSMPWMWVPLFWVPTVLFLHLVSLRRWKQGKTSS